jgi:hypothetical protein
MTDIPLVPEDRISVDEVIVIKPKDGDGEKRSRDGRKKDALFSFPYPTPYQIQIEFMTHLFTTIEDRKLGIFESPTGTVSTETRSMCESCNWQN